MICSKCGKAYSLSEINDYAHCCDQPLLVKYAYDVAMQKSDFKSREKSMWRYFEMLPVKDRNNIVSLGEGMTPIIHLNKLAAGLGLSSLLMKDESSNPTGSFKARGISAAVSKAKEFGISRCIIPTAGNAGGAMAAYCQKAGMECTVVMPRHTPDFFKEQCIRYGAELILVEGLINDCGKKVQELRKLRDYYDVSTLKEPYRLEGKKTMGLEIAEQLDWQLPDVIICPVGGGTGLIGIWKAINEMLELGWVQDSLPRMIAVQAANCAPLLATYADAKNWKQEFRAKPSMAYGLAVPYPFAMDLMRKVIDESHGHVVAVSEEEIQDGIDVINRDENILVSPEGAAAFKSLRHLLERNMIREDDTVLFLNTGSGEKSTV